MLMCSQEEGDLGRLQGVHAQLLVEFRAMEQQAEARAQSAAQREAQLGQRIEEVRVFACVMSITYSSVFGMRVVCVT
jgi:hypothetical protein